MKTTTAPPHAQKDAMAERREDNLIKTAPQNELPLSVSALICTRNRAGSIAVAVGSVLANTGGQMELIVVDQSPGEETAAALAPFLSDPRLRYIRTATVGLSIARNIALREARYSICAFTDDDCEALPGWAASHAQAFQDNPNVAVSYGNVIAAEYNSTAGFTQGYLIKQDFLGVTIRHKLKARGIGANMAIRRDMALQIGGFDTELGVGARLPSCEDGDFAVRCLLAGYYIYETQGSVVIHHGFRTWAEGRQLTRDAFVGIGAAYIKPLKCGKFDVLPLLAYEFWTYALRPSLQATLALRKPLNWQRVLCFLRGVARGLASPVDGKTLLYRPKNA